MYIVYNICINLCILAKENCKIIKLLKDCSENS